MNTDPFTFQSTFIKVMTVHGLVPEVTIHESNLALAYIFLSFLNHL